MEETRKDLTLYEKVTSAYIGKEIRVYTKNGYQVAGKVLDEDSSGILILSRSTQKKSLVLAQAISTIEPD